ncbi:hypothetical protein F0562_026868 [Nyssa sinensis]|uniref:Uncharacterized protein n=1 Tax=Nyssa sinensis TaxID=561372 RepID=A0A5J5B2C0_9ASTE|nr:hypothetical protein F0562_026868 [Nyssa sinensis]
MATLSSSLEWMEDNGLQQVGTNTISGMQFRAAPLRYIPNLGLQFMWLLIIEKYSLVAVSSFRRDPSLKVHPQSPSTHRSNSLSLIR